MQVYTPLVPTIYCIVVLSFLMPICLLITFQLTQIVNSDYQFNILNKHGAVVNLSMDDTFILAKICMKKKLWFSSIRMLEAKLLEDPNQHFRCLNLIGLSYYNMKQYNIAKNYYLKACSYNESYIPTLQNLAELYEVTKDLTSALQVYKLIIDYDPENKLANKRLTKLKKSG